MKGRIVFLYSELAGYVLGCLNALSEVAPVAVAHWPVHPEAPFKLPKDAPYELLDRSGLGVKDLERWIEEQEPRALVVSGWMDRGYVAVARKWRNRIPVVLTLDNPWTGSWRQWVAVGTAPWFLRRAYNRTFYPGVPQRPFVERLGIEPTAEGWYCADVGAFDAAFSARAPTCRLLYVGRYLPFKGVDELWEAFVSLTDRFPDWELHAVGTGAGWDQRMEHPQIVHHGFLQPAELSQLVSKAAAFVMPSRKEPWGVVLHEMAAAGLPLIASDAVGAATRFLEPGRNGFSFPVGDLPALTRALERMMECTDEQRATMGTASHELALSWTPDHWAAALLNLIA